MKSVALLLSLFSPLVALRAQGPEPAAGLVALHQAALDLSTDGVVLNVAAHPDDESSRTNTMLRRKYGLRVVTVYSTFGDGGQNAIGREIGPELAELRVRETLRAAAMSDVEVRWLGMPDFGFSKTLEETLSVWGEENLLQRMRAVVAEVQPDLVITNHSIDRGHGHHRASFWAIEKVLRERAAAGEDPVPLYRRCGVEEAQWTMEPAELDPARGETYAALAHRAWTQHVTQGPWGPHDPMRVGKDWWKCAWPEVAAERAADWQAWFGGRGVGDFAAFDERRPEQLMAAALRVYRESRDQFLARPGPGVTRSPRQTQVLARRMDVARRALLTLANVRVQSWLEHDEVPQGGNGKVFVIVHGVERVAEVAVTVDGVEAGPAEVAMRSTPFDGLPAAPANATTASEEKAEAPEPPPPPTPPKSAALPGRFVAEFPCRHGRDDELSSDPRPSFCEVKVSLRLDGELMTFGTELAYTPVPRIAVRWDRDVVMLPKGKRVERLLTARVTSHIETPTDDAVRLAMGPGIKALSTPGRLELSPEHPEARLLVRTTIDADERTPDASLLVGFGDSAARLRMAEVDVNVPEHLRVALVRGPDDSTELALADLGVDYVSLDADALLTARFEQFETILLDIRAYHHRPELAEVQGRLLSYCRGGGRVVAMYHKPNEWNERAGHPSLAPFPLVVGNDRVTEENAAVTFLQPEHRLMTHPHRLSAADFTGWVQERGLNFPSRWDDAWTPLLAMKDSGEKDVSTGALLYTSYGKGDFVYCSLALYRQLRVGNAGAARLLVNLLSR